MKLPKEMQKKKRRKDKIMFIDIDEIREEFGEYSNDFIKILKEDAKKAGIDIMEEDET